MMVSQPRRIAAKSLMKRLQSVLGDKVGLRMGQVREETDNTKIWFVTSGYLARYLSHTRQFCNLTHLIIDEVHERSLDGDLCCYLARELSLKHPNLRIILMSATLDANLYRNYFSDYQKCIDYIDSDISCEVETIFVGTKRFPIEIHYVEDLLESSNYTGNNSNGIGKSNDCINGLFNCCKLLSKKEEQIPSLQFIQKQYDVAIHIIRTMSTLGTAVLVFVAGIVDIDYFVNHFEDIDRYNVICVHSQIPLDEQEAIFLPTPPYEVKLIIATNAAESSITLPDVEIVICLGFEKLITYNEKYHRVELVPHMISKASAQQRAGRTGRVGPGRVFRLYTKSLYETFREHGEGEVLRVPLHDMILKLRSMLEDSLDFNGIIPVLSELPEPPEIENISKSFEYLFDIGLITEDSDEGKLTIPGKFLSQLTMSIRLGRFLVYAILLGIFEEAVIIVAALQLSRTPFRLPSPYIVKDPAVINSWRQKVFLLMTKYDKGSYSEPIMLLNIYLSWKTIPSNERLNWCKSQYLDIKIMRIWDGSIKEIKNRVCDILHNYETNLVGIPCKESILWNLIKMCMVWCAEDNLLQMESVHKKMKPYNQQMDISDKDQKYFDHVLKLIPKGLNYCTTKATTTYQLNISFLNILQHFNLNDIIETYLKFSSQLFQFKILCCRLEDYFYVHFFVKREHLNILSQYFKQFDLLSYPTYELENDWIWIEFENPNIQQFQSLLHPLKIKNPHIVIIFDDQVDYTFVKTNIEEKILEDLFLVWNQNIKTHIRDKKFEYTGSEIYFYDNNPPNNAIEDVPLGIRLFNFLIRGYKDR